jgi:hypothetical protein
MREPDQVNEGNPFPGLRPFEIEEYHLFFGRDGQSDELVERLHRHRFVAVVGTSGSGKSSLIRAGLLPALHGGLMAGAGSLWRVVLMRPGHDPLGNLAYELRQSGVLTESADPEIQNALVETTLRRSTLGLVDVVRQARILAGENVLVVVDQFEELFRFKEANKHTTSADDAAHFAKLLIIASAQKEAPIYVVITMRSDFLGDCSQFVGLPEAINESQYLIPRMSRDEREAAIKGPIRVGDGEITVPLVNRLLNDIGDNPDQLPILQHALMRTWNYWSEHRRNGDPIGLEDYEAIGTMSAALSSHANEAFAELKDERSTRIAEKLFKRLSEKGTDNREIRRPTRLGEICDVAEATLKEVAAVVNVFRRKGRSFLMPPEEIQLTVDTILDISHESLIRVWDKLREWTAKESDSARMYRRLSNATTDFGTSHLPDSLLDAALEWRELQKPNAAWAERYRHTSDGDPTFEEVMAFVDRSKAARDASIEKAKRDAEQQRLLLLHEKENAELLAEREREIAATQRQIAATERDRAEQAQVFATKQASTARKLRFLVAALFFLLILAAGAVAFAYNSRALAYKASADAKASEEKALAAARVAETEQKRADQEKENALASATAAKAASSRADEERKKAQKSADIANAANTKLRSTTMELRNALTSAQTAQAETRKKEEETAQLRQDQLDTRDANQDLRQALIEIDAEKKLRLFENAREKFDRLKEYKDAGDSYLQSATLRANISSANDSDIVKDFDDAIRNFQMMSNATEVKERNDGKQLEAGARFAKGDYLTNTLWRAPDDTKGQRFSQGIQSLEDATTIYEDAGNVDSGISTLRLIATKSSAYGNTKKAADTLERARKLYITKKDWTGLTTLLFELALNDASNKTHHLDEVVTISKEHNDSATNNQMLRDVARFYVDTMTSDDDLKSGIAVYEQALNGVNGDNEKANLLFTIAAQLRFNVNEPARKFAGNYYKRALDIYLRLNDKDWSRTILSSFVGASDASEALRLWPEAFDYMERCLALFDPKEKALFLLQIGAARKSVDQLPLAVEAFQRAADIFATLPDVGIDEAATRIEIGNLRVALKKDPAAAIQSFKRAQELYHAANESNLNNSIPCYSQFSSQEADAFSSIGSVQESSNQLPAALNSYTRARDLYKKVYLGDVQANVMESKIQDIQKRLSKR